MHRSDHHVIPYMSMRQTQEPRTRSETNAIRWMLYASIVLAVDRGKLSFVCVSFFSTLSLPLTLRGDQLRLNRGSRE